ncbi:MAG: M48 family metallopeptidase [Rickettsiales bacterium]
MAFASVGLSTHIWNNQIKSVLLLIGFPVLLLMLVFTAFGLLGNGPDFIQGGIFGIEHYGHYAILIAAVWFSIAFFFHQSLINAGTGARPLSRTDNPRAYNLLENLCISRGLTMPKLYVIESPVLNAYASGISEKNYAITLTRGIMEALTDSELEAVLGHELSHIRHKDVRLLIIAVVFAGMITYLSEMIYRALVYGRGKRDGRVILVALAIIAVGYVFAILLRFALSRQREYLADAGAVELTHNPDSMIGALQKISGRSRLPGIVDDVRQMCIDNDVGFMGGLFMTHPPIKKRIEALVSVGGRVIESSEAGNSFTSPWGNPNNLKRRYGPWG